MTTKTLTKTGVVARGIDIIDHVVVVSNSKDCRLSLYLVDRGFNRIYTLVFGMPIQADSSAVVMLRLGLDETEELHYASDSDELTFFPRRK